VVRRHDRVAESGTGFVRRLHQEDTAQMLGLNTDDPIRKFQYGARLPSLAAIAVRLTSIGIPLERLLALTTFNVAIGNIDAHAKNISVLHLPDGRHRLAPAYDVAMHLHQGTGEERFAMDVSGKRNLNALGAAQLIAEAVSWKMTRRRAFAVVADTVERLGEGLRLLDRGAYPGVGDDAWRVVTRRVASLRDELRDEVGSTRPTRVRPARPEQPREPGGRPTGGRFAPYTD
jgi:serine/threonine-protein kinase HipA